jgi:hypothetical protein
MATSTAARLSHASAWTGAPVPAAVQSTAYGLGGLMLTVEGIVHIEQYISIFREVTWIGPLFIANGAASLIVALSLAFRRTRHIAAFAGVVISVVALGSLVISYGNGLFGWQEGGFRTPVAIALIAEVGAVVFLAGGTAAAAVRKGRVS